MISGAPNLAIQVVKKHVAIVSADVSVIGVASGHLVYLSIIVRQYLLPFTTGNGPTMSRCMCWKRSSGTSMCSGIRRLWRWILVRWHGKHVRTHAVVSLFMFGHMKRLAMALRVAFAPGCDALWIVWIILLRNVAGI